MSKGPNQIIISAADLGPGPHTVEVVKRTETWQGVLTFTGIRLGTSAQLVAPLPLPKRKLLFIGDSVTCGAGVDNYPVCPAENNRHSNAYDAYSMVLGRRLDAQAELVCWSGRGVVRDYLGHRDGKQALSSSTIPPWPTTSRSVPNGPMTAGLPTP